jgi:hypothetical protein
MRSLKSRWSSTSMTRVSVAGAFPRHLLTSFGRGTEAAPWSRAPFALDAQLAAQGRRPLAHAPGAPSCSASGPNPRPSSETSAISLPLGP